ncbi:hypothetical protein SAMN04488074_13516 [Lentzea albidocapillata subsp. violacea]|uniref:Wadjet protein JetD C-terminal domain-containing protein n=1 Tax=Lentzea albidocapillata subsp. violacea TaxID=128104 RepID=A0A1G9YSW4_9PSEU|nr:DUF3322 domain-containing protein [Lentzea albidocapillata]SDN11725.1 hypothetical protein SAMN04488074_13516 [Lentzea albidocapillata subsp. violacea]
MAAPRTWSTPTDVVNRLKRRWDNGDFLRMFAAGEEWVPLEIPLRSPTANDLSTRFGEVQEWVSQWRQVDQRLQRVETRTVGGRLIGTNEVPGRVWIDSYDQLWSLLRRTSDVRRFSELLHATQELAPGPAGWMIAKPLEALSFDRVWDKLIATVLWIDNHATRDMYVRQVDVPGVDTKFIEGHRKILGLLLDHQLPAHRIDSTYPHSEFASRYRFRRKPGYVRFRWLDSHEGFSELGVRVDELARRPLPVSTVFVVENEVTYLAFPPVADSVVVFGGGYALSQLEPLTWLSERQLVYWGDIDTHGFAILDRLRAKFGHVRSMLMDRATLLAHEDQWVSESAPVNAHLGSLQPNEAALYTDLVEDVLGTAVRLEQERVSFSALQDATR